MILLIPYIYMVYGIWYIYNKIIQKYRVDDAVVVDILPLLTKRSVLWLCGLYCDKVQYFQRSKQHACLHVRIHVIINFINLNFEATRSFHDVNNGVECMRLFRWFFQSERWWSRIIHAINGCVSRFVACSWEVTGFQIRRVWSYMCISILV
jgi:hypothetical protein